MTTKELVDAAIADGTVNRLVWQGLPGQVIPDSVEVRSRVQPEGDGLPEMVVIGVMVKLQDESVYPEGANLFGFQVAMDCSDDASMAELQLILIAGCSNARAALKRPDLLARKFHDEQEDGQ